MVFFFTILPTLEQCVCSAGSVDTVGGVEDYRWFGKKKKRFKVILSRCCFCDLSNTHSNWEGENINLFSESAPN